MDHLTTRREFVRTSAIVAAASLSAPVLLHGAATEEANVPANDYHVHLTDDFGIEQAVALANQRGVKFGIVEHPGPGSRIQNDDHLREYIATLRKCPVYVGLQPMQMGWTNGFSPSLIDELDYILMDADTVPVPDGGYLRIYQNDLFIEDMNAFMELYMAHILNILENAPISIFARPTYLPINFARHYDTLWTRKRMAAIIDRAKARSIALEIQENVRVPSESFIKLAKAAGVKFTFGTNARNNNAGNFHYCLEMAKTCGLSKDDMFAIKKG